MNSQNALPPAVAQAQQAGTTVSPTIVAADNGFGWNLFETLTQGSTGNVAISPLSVSLVLQIIYNGASGTTQQAMAQTLQLQGLDISAINADNAALQASLLNPDPQVHLALANSLWMHLAQNPVSTAFTQVNQTYYGAEIGDLAGAPANVNAWVSGVTDGLITNILAPANYALVDAVIVNALYFKGAWTNAFDPSLTRPAPFTLADGTQTSVQMMQRLGNYPYFRGTNFQVLQLPYGQNQRMSMLIVLPDFGVDSHSFVAAMTSSMLGTWNSELHSAYGSVSLPRFTTDYAASLPAALTALGMGVAFDPNEANFSGIAPLTYLSDVEHKTVVQVDENGTVAAAATSGTVGVTVVQDPEFSMTVDHPFFYAILDARTGVLLFIGTMFNPV